MSISLVSFFNTTNIGDLLISRALKDKVEKYGYVKPIDYLGTGNIKPNIYIGRQQKKYDGNTTGSVKAKKYAKQIIYKLGLEKTILLYHSYFNKINITGVEENIKESEALIIGGGNMIFDLIPSSISANRFNYYVEIAKKYDKKVFAISIGIGPFQNNYQKRQAVKSLSKCDYITFRDKKSYDIFISEKPDFKNAFIVADPVFFSEHALSPLTKKDSIGVNIINSKLFPAEQEYKKVIKSYSLLIDKLIKETNKDIIIFNTESKDYDTCVRVYDQCLEKRKITIKEVKHEEDLYEIYNKCELLIGTRMHSLITAFAQGVPIIGLSWQQKVDAMFEMIEDPESVFKLFEMNASFNQIIDRCKYKLVNNEEKKTKHIMEKLRKKEMINDSILREILS